MFLEKIRKKYIFKAKNISVYCMDKFSQWSCPIVFLAHCSSRTISQRTAPTVPFLTVPTVLFRIVSEQGIISHLCTRVIQMMLPVLSSEFVYHCMKNLAVVRVYRQPYYDSNDSKITSIIFTAVDHIIGRQQGFACNGIQMTRTTAQVHVASSESPPCFGTTINIARIIQYFI